MLQQSPFELAYRALNELMLALLAHHPANTAERVAIWDDFMMCKVLPRIEGDSDKLRSHQTADSDLLTDLEKVLAEQFGSHWDNTRPDLFNRKVAAAGEDSARRTAARPLPQQEETGLDERAADTAVLYQLLAVRGF